MGKFKSFLQKWHTWKQLSQEERLLFLQALILIPGVALSLQLWGLKRTQAILSKLFHSKIYQSSTAQIAQIFITLKMLQLATRYSCWRTSCLKKSLVLWYLLRRQGIVAQLQIGVRLELNQFQAHAWLEYEGYVIGDRQDVRQQYTAFDPLSQELNSYLASL